MADFKLTEETCPWCNGGGTRSLNGRDVRCNNERYHPDKKHPLSDLQEPGIADIARALFVAVFMARESLSLAERDDDLERACPEVPLRYIDDALGNLRAAEGYLMRPLRRHTSAATRSLAQRSVHAAEAAAAQLRRLGSYDHDDEHPRKVIVICRRATETARKDAHKLLVAVMELFPDSYEKDEFFDAEEEKEEETEA